MEQEIIKFLKSVGDEHNLLGPTVGTPQDLAFAYLNQTARQERKWIPLAQPHEYICSTRDLELAQLKEMR